MFMFCLLTNLALIVGFLGDWPKLLKDPLGGKTVSFQGIDPQETERQRSFYLSKLSVVDPP